VISRVELIRNDKEKFLSTRKTGRARSGKPALGVFKESKRVTIVRKFSSYKGWIYSYLLIHMKASSIFLVNVLNCVAMGVSTVKALSLYGSF
jgi:hypothetical protein